MCNSKVALQLKRLTTKPYTNSPITMNNRYYLRQKPLITNNITDITEIPLKMGILLNPGWMTIRKEKNMAGIYSLNPCDLTWKRRIKR